MQQVHTKALLRQHLRSDWVNLSSTRFVTVPAQLPNGTVQDRSLLRLVQRLSQTPGVARLFTLDEFPDASFKVFTLRSPAYVLADQLLLPKGSYIICMPDGEYRFSTPQDPFTPGLQAKLGGTESASFLEPNPGETPTPKPLKPKKEKSGGWPGPRDYIDVQQLAKDVVKYNRPFVRYPKTAYGPVRLYEIPKGVVYHTHLNTKIFLHRAGIYAIMLQERTGKLSFINKTAYYFGEPEHP